jgi:hypothetical protein
MARWRAKRVFESMTSIAADYIARRFTPVPAEGGVLLRGNQKNNEAANQLEPVETVQATSATETANADGAASSVKLSDEAQATLRQLQATDRKVRAHELAHLAASGGLATGGPIYTYQKGPDGVNYAVGGEVSIDTSPAKTPEETIAKAAIIIAAALAPADPSPQDRAVAAAASQLAQQARAELQAEAIAQQKEARNQDAVAYGRQQDLINRNYLDPRISGNIDVAASTASDASNKTLRIDQFA